MRDLYLAEVGRIIARNTAEAFGGQVINKSLVELLDKEEKPQETAEEIKERIIGKINGRI